MSEMQKIAAYQELLERIKSSIDSVDDQITSLVAEYENLKALYEAVSGDIVVLAASMNSSSALS